MIAIRYVFVLAVLILLAGCDTREEQDNFAEEASRPPSGFTRTDEGGEELSVDEDDWRTSPVYAGRFFVAIPAYPNPVDIGGFVTIEVTVTAFGSVSAPLRAERLRENGLLERLDQIDQAADPGRYVFTFPAGLFERRGLHRVFIFDAVGEIVSYGDIMVE